MENFSKKENSIIIPMKKPIEVFLRHCYYSKLQELDDRSRPIWFNMRKVFQNFIDTLDPDIVNYTIVYDEFYGDIKKTFLSNEKNVKIVNHGSECDSFLSTLDLITSKNFDDDQIIYLLEDDYLHKPGWCNILLEGFDDKVNKEKFSNNYITLYDFNYFYGRGYLCDLFLTKSCRWRAVPATTNTFACTYKTLKEDMDVHIKYSSTHAHEKDGSYYSRDYKKFYELQESKRYVLSSIPGWSTHCHPKHLSPFIDWKEIIDREYIEEKSKNVTAINYS